VEWRALEWFACTCRLQCDHLGVKTGGITLRMLPHEEGCRILERKVVTLTSPVAYGHGADGGEQGVWERNVQDKHTGTMHTWMVEFWVCREKLASGEVCGAKWRPGGVYGHRHHLDLHKDQRNPESLPEGHKDYIETPERAGCPGDN